MNSLTIKSAILCLALAVSSCNSSTDSKGGGTPAPVAPPSSPSDVNVDQFDENEKSTTELSSEEQAVAFETLTDVGRSSYVGSKTQDANTPQEKTGSENEGPVQPKPFVGALVSNEKTQGSEGQFYDKETLSQNIIQTVNQKQLCNPQVQQNSSEAKSDLKFTTSGTKCPMVIQSAISVVNTNVQDSFDVSADGTFKFIYNEQALPALKKQDLLSGELNLKMKMKIKFPTEQSPDMTTSGSGEESGKYISRKLGEVIGTKKVSFATEMKGLMSGGPNNSGSSGNSGMPVMVARSVVQIELRTAVKKVVLTVKMDSQNAEPVKCSLNKKSIDLDQCEELINKLNLREQTQPSQKSNSNSDPVDHG